MTSPLAAFGCAVVQMSAGQYSAADADAEEARRLQSRDDEETARLLSRDVTAARNGNARAPAPAIRGAGAGAGGGGGQNQNNANPNANANANNGNGGNGNGNNGNAANGNGGGGDAAARQRMVTLEQARRLSETWESLKPWVTFLAVLWGLVAVLWLCVYAYELHLFRSYRALPAGADEQPRDAAGNPVPALPGQFCEKRLPLWLGVDGITGLVFVCGLLGTGVAFYFLLRRLVLAGDTARSDTESQRLLDDVMPQLIGLLVVAVVTWLLGVFRVCWAIVGSVWVYAIDRHTHLCPDAVFRFQWMRQTLGWAWIGVFVLFICVSVCTLLCLIKKPTPAEGADANPNAPNANANANGNANPNANGNGTGNGNGNANDRV